MSKSKFFRILSIDGGGIRGLIPAQILAVLEGKLQKATNDPNTRIADWFDLIAGTSTGGILTCIYLCPVDAGSTRPRFTAADAVELYREHGHEIFNLTFWRKIKALGMIDEKYPAKGLETLLQEKFGDLKLSQLIKNCLITAYDIQTRHAYFFTQQDAVSTPHRNFYLRDVARATSAAPTYFECARIESETKINYTLIDGGLFANDPALCAYAEARKLGSKPTAKEMVILSLGTGIVDTPYQYAEAKDWGGLQWVKPIIDILMSGSVEVTDYQLRQMYMAVKAQKQYLRIQPAIAPRNTDLGNSEAENIEELVRIGQDAAEKNDAALDHFVSLLRSSASAN